VLWKPNSRIRHMGWCLTQSRGHLSFLFTSINLPCTSYLFNIGSSSWHMARGKALSDDLRDVLLHMAQSLDVNTITKYTGCKRRTIERILSDFRKMGSVARRHLRKGSLQGRRRTMKGQDVQVRPLAPFFCICLPFHSCAVSARPCSP